MTVCVFALQDAETAAIDAFLARCGGPGLSDDPAVAQYIHGLLADREAFAGEVGDAGAVESLDDVLCGFDAACWGSATETERHTHLCGLLAEVGDSHLVQVLTMCGAATGKVADGIFRI